MTQRLAKRVRMPWRPIIGYGEGDVVSLGSGDYWRVERATIERYRGTWSVFLYLDPLDPGEVLSGFGELAVDRIVDLSEVIL